MSATIRPVDDPGLAVLIVDVVDERVDVREVAEVGLRERQSTAPVADGREMEDGPGRAVKLGGPAVLEIVGDALDGEDGGTGLLGQLSEFAHHLDRAPLAGQADVAG